MSDRLSILEGYSKIQQVCRVEMVSDDIRLLSFNARHLRCRPPNPLCLQGRGRSGVFRQPVVGRKSLWHDATATFWNTNCVLNSFGRKELQQLSNVESPSWSSWAVSCYNHSNHDSYSTGPIGCTLDVELDTVDTVVKKGLQDLHRWHVYWLQLLGWMSQRKQPDSLIQTVSAWIISQTRLVLMAGQMATTCYNISPYLFEAPNSQMSWCAGKYFQFPI